MSNILFEFGSHRGKTFQEVFDNHPNYIDWVRAQHGKIIIGQIPSDSRDAMTIKQYCAYADYRAKGRNPDMKKFHRETGLWHDPKKQQHLKQNYIAGTVGGKNALTAALFPGMDSSWADDDAFGADDRDKKEEKKQPKAPAPKAGGMSASMQAAMQQSQMQMQQQITRC